MEKVGRRGLDDLGVTLPPARILLTQWLHPALCTCSALQGATGDDDVSVGADCLRALLLLVICQGFSRDWTPGLECKASWWRFPWEVMSSGLTDVRLAFLSSFIILNNSILGTRTHPFHCQNMTSVSTSPRSRLPLTDRTGIPRIPEMATKPFHANLGSGVL